MFISKFFQENLEIDWEKFKSRLVKSINKKYSLIFVKSPKNNDDFINSIIFSIGYLIHMLFFQIFPLDRPLFTIRFILDVYHIIIFQLHGLFISDYYLQNQFEKVFTSKFMDYEIAKIGLVSFKEEGEEEHKKSTIRTPSFILSKGNPKINENNFQEFAGELSNKLKVKPKLLKKRDSERSMTTIAHARIASKSESKPVKYLLIIKNT